MRKAKWLLPIGGISVLGAIGLLWFTVLLSHQHEAPLRRPPPVCWHHRNSPLGMPCFIAIALDAMGHRLLAQRKGHHCSQGSMSRAIIAM